MPVRFLGSFDRNGIFHEFRALVLFCWFDSSFVCQVIELFEKFNHGSKIAKCFAWSKVAFRATGNEFLFKLVWRCWFRLFCSTDALFFFFFWGGGDYKISLVWNSFQRTFCVFVKNFLPKQKNNTMFFQFTYWYSVSKRGHNLSEFAVRVKLAPVVSVRTNEQSTGDIWTLFLNKSTLSTNWFVHLCSK